MPVQYAVEDFKLSSWDRVEQIMPVSRCRAGENEAVCPSVCGKSSVLTTTQRARRSQRLMPHGLVRKRRSGLVRWRKYPVSRGTGRG